MKKNTTEIIHAYTMGSISLEEANRRLNKLNAGFLIDPERCKLTPEMIEAGWGLLDTGTGTLNPVQVKNGVLVDNDIGNMPAFIHLNGQVYEVKGRKVLF